MATVTGITAAKALEILGQSVTSGFINGSGHLILVRDNNETIDAGDFTAIVTDVMNDAVATQVAAQDIPAQVNTAVEAGIYDAMAGTIIAKGDISGAVSLSSVAINDLVNATVTGKLVGNITINSADFPAAPKPGTQFAFRMTQDAIGGRTLTLTSIKKSNGILTLSTAPNAVDMIMFMFDGTNWYAGAMGLNFS